MKSAFFISIILIVCFLTGPISALAFETDQFNLPPVPLADIGDEVSEYVEDNLRGAVADINSEIGARKLCIDTTSGNQSGCGPVGQENDKLEKLWSGDAIADALAKRLGGSSLMFTKIGKWMHAHQFRRTPSSYKTGYGESIYIALPSNYLTISPTVRLYGVEFGVDKIEHLFQQGYKYYRMQNEAVAKGEKEDVATRRAVAWGQRTERTYYGLLVSGVYSNADLFANYAGMKMYQGLTRRVKIGDVSRPPLVTLTDGVWKIDESRLRENLLKPYLAENMNEALNPSGYAFNLIGAVRHAVKGYACPEWKKTFPDLTADAVTAKSKSLELWNGEDYGFAVKGKMVRLGETCFDSPPLPKNANQ